MDREQKRAQFSREGGRKTLPIVLIAVFVVAAVAAGWALLSPSDAPTLRVEKGQVVIPLAQVSDGKAHFFSVRSGGTDVRFFVLKSHDGIVRAAFDTCDVCYREKKGYRQEGDSMVCNNCDQRFRSDLINEVRGGCNPAPLERRIEGDKLVIAEADIAGGAWYFQVSGK